VICSWAPRALANRHRVGRREAGHATCPACLASHAPLAAASFAGAVFGWRRRTAFYLHAVSYQARLLALQRGGRKRSSLINPPHCLDHPAHMGTREHTVRSGCCDGRRGIVSRIHQISPIPSSVPDAVHLLSRPCRVGTDPFNLLKSDVNFPFSYTPCCGLEWHLPFEG